MMSKRDEQLAYLMTHAIADRFKQDNLSEAFDSIVAAYYEEYTDATEVEGEFYSAFESIFNLCFPFGMPDGREFDDAIKKKKQ
jgi:hypothetical protein